MFTCIYPCLPLFTCVNLYHLYLSVFTRVYSYYLYLPVPVFTGIYFILYLCYYLYYLYCRYLPVFTCIYLYLPLLQGLSHLLHLTIFCMVMRYFLWSYCVGANVMISRQKSRIEYFQHRNFVKKLFLLFAILFVSNVPNEANCVSLRTSSMEVWKSVLFFSSSVKIYLLSLFFRYWLVTSHSLGILFSKKSGVYLFNICYVSILE